VFGYVQIAVGNTFYLVVHREEDLGG
jgi:hypothetical protein